MERILLACAAAATLFVSTSNAWAFTIKEALAAAYQTNPTLQAERSNLKAVDENVPQAYAGYLPTITSTYTRARDREEIGTSPLDERTSYTAALNFNQPLFQGGGTVAAVDRAESTVEAGRQSLHGIEQSVFIETITSFIDVVRASEVLSLSTHNENVLKEQLGATKNRFDLGESTRTDVAQAESRVSFSISDRVSAEGDLIEAKAEFKRVVGIDISDKVLTTPNSLPPIPATLNDAMSIALKNNPNLLESMHLLEVAKSDIGISRSVILPSVDLVGRVSREQGIGSTRGNNLDDESIGINVTVPIFQSGAEYASLRQSMRTAEQRESGLDETRKQIESIVTTAWKDVKTSRATIVASQDAVRAAEVALEGVRQEHEVGARTVLDILDAEQELFIARVDLATARRNEVVAVYNLLASMGQLTADKMDLGVELYDPTEHYENVRYKFLGL